MNADRTPWSSEAEQSVIGSILLDNSAAWRVADLKTEHFYSVDHRLIWSAIMTLVAAHKPADVITVFDQLQSLGKAEEFGGRVYLNALAQSVPSASNAGRYAEIVIEKATQRAVLAAADEAMAIAREEAGTAADKLDRAAALFTRIRQHGHRAEPRSLGDLIEERTNHWEALEGGSITSGIPTCLPMLDRALAGGLRPGSLYVVAARPSIGKTSFAGQLALSFAQQGRAVLVLSQEMRAVDLADRAAANLGRVDLEALTTGSFGGDDWSRIVDVGEQAARLPLYVDDQPGLTLAAINAKARRQHQQHGLHALIVDYLQLCSGSNPRDNRNLQIEEISRGLKTLAKDLGIAVIALAQLNRQSVQRGEPDLSDLRDSGAIEQDADVVLFLHPKGKLPDGALLIAGILAKNRQGRRYRVALAFYGNTQHWIESTAGVS